MTDNEVIDLGGKRIRFIDTPHTPHGWDAGVLYEETTRTLLCGDLFTQLGNERAMTDGDVWSDRRSQRRTYSSIPL
jgi:flavorubredoxin